METKVFAVIDTDVILSALLVNESSLNLLDLVESNNIVPIFDKNMLEEYYNILNSKRFGLDKQDVYDTLFTIVDKGIMLNDIEKTKEALKDVKEVPFLEVKESTEEFSSYLITGNIDRYPLSSSTVSSKDVISIMENIDSFVSLDLNYDKNIERLKEMQLLTPKYSSGKEIVDKMFDTDTKTIKKSYLGRD